MFDLTRTFNLVIGALFNPESTWRGYLAEAGDWKRTALMLTGPLIIAATLLAYLSGLIGADASLFGRIRPTIVSSLINLVMGVIAAGVVALVFGWLAGAFGGKGSFSLALAATTLAFVPGYAGQAVTWVPWLGGLLAFGLAIYGLVLLWRIIPLYLEVPDGKRAPHYIVSLVACLAIFFALSKMLGGMLPGLSSNSPFAQLPGADRPESAAPGIFGSAARQAELITMAEADRYSPPANEEVTERQVQDFIHVMNRLANEMTDKEARLREIAEKVDRDKEVSMRDFGSMMSGMSEVAGMQTAEIEAVKANGGNWAEHQWVKATLRSAWMQKQMSNTDTHNSMLYEKHEEQLAEHIAW